jgi:hypothetical protein
MKLLQDTYQEVSQHHALFLKEQEIKRQTQLHELHLESIKKQTSTVIID